MQDTINEAPIAWLALSFGRKKSSYFTLLAMFNWLFKLYVNEDAWPVGCRVWNGWGVGAPYRDRLHITPLTLNLKKSSPLLMNKQQKSCAGMHYQQDWIRIQIYIFRSFWTYKVYKNTGNMVNVWCCIVFIHFLTS